MAKEILTRVWCDLCLGEDEEREEATHTNNAVTLGLGGRARPLTLDLCERHLKELLEPLAEALAAYGAPVGDTPLASPRRGSYKRKDGPFRCLVEGCDAALLSTIDSFGKHLRKQHGIGVRQYRDRYGEPLPVGGQASHQREAEPDLFADESLRRGPSPEMPLRHIPELGVPMYCPFEDCTLGVGRRPAKNKRSLSAHFSKAHEVGMAEWFRQHPEVDPESLLVRDEA